MSSASLKPRKVSRAIEIKKKEVSSLLDMIRSHRWVGIADVSRIPASNLTQLRRDLRGKLLIRVSKQTLIKHALEQCKKEFPGIERLIPSIRGSCALLLSNENPFKIQKLLLRSRTTLPAKGGEVSPVDIVIPAGPTNFKPGPIISELQKVGLQAGIEASRVVIKKEKVLVKKGEVISRDIASVLTKMDIKPLQIGLDLICLYENGTIYDSSVLTIDEEKIINDVRKAHEESLALAMSIGWLNEITLPILLRKAYRDALVTAQTIAYIAPETIDLLVIRAASEMSALASHIGEGAGGGSPGETQTAPEHHEPKKKEEKKEDDVASGLGALFG